MSAALRQEMLRLEELDWKTSLKYESLVPGLLQETWDYRQRQNGLRWQAESLAIAKKQLKKKKKDKPQLENETPDLVEHILDARMPYHLFPQTVYRQIDGRLIKVATYKPRLADIEQHLRTSVQQSVTESKQTQPLMQNNMDDDKETDSDTESLSDVTSTDSLSDNDEDTDTDAQSDTFEATNNAALNSLIGKFCSPFSIFVELQVFRLALDEAVDNGVDNGSMKQLDLRSQFEGLAFFLSFGAVFLLHQSLGFFDPWCR